MAWRCDSNFLDNLDRCTVGLAKGASMGLITYLVIKLIGVAHDNEWAYLATGWGSWFMLELAVGVVLPLFLFVWAIKNQRMGVIRAAAALTVFGIVLNRLNTALIAFNWQLYQEIPHIFEVIITITVFAIYIAVYRFILYRLPILFTWKELPQEETVTESVTAGAAPVQAMSASASAVYRSID
jgi:Ni/Fe-hydrogenase subunit HybB-like protein